MKAHRSEATTLVNGDSGGRKQCVVRTACAVRAQLGVPIGDNAQRPVTDGHEVCPEGLGELGPHRTRVLIDVASDQIYVR